MISSYSPVLGDSFQKAKCNPLGTNKRLKSAHNGVNKVDFGVNILVGFWVPLYNAPPLGGVGGGDSTPGGGYDLQYRYRKSRKEISLLFMLVYSVACWLLTFLYNPNHDGL